MKNTFIIFIAFILSFSCEDKFKDNCTQGQNMSNIRIAERFNVYEQIPTLRFTWDTGTEKGSNLPKEYFEEVIIAEETKSDIFLIIQSVECTNIREISIQFIGISKYLNIDNEIEIVLEFPDRRYYINCDHAGMDDRYLLFINLKFDGRRDLIENSFEERLLAGAL